MLKQQNNFLPFFMWFFPVLFFAYQFILRLWPGLMMQSIMRQFSIDASGFGLLAACYYYGYASMQIPIAILLQKFGTKKTIFSFTALCGLAMFLFSQTTNFYLALFSRFLIGVGSAVGFLGVSQVISEWFIKERYANMVGFSFSFGLLGAVYGGKPLSLLLAHYDSHLVALALSLISLCIAGSVLLTLRTSPATKIHSNHSLQIADLVCLISSKNIWILAIANLLMVGALEGFADVWSISYLTKAYSLNKNEAALLTSFIFVGMLFGGPLLAACAKRIGHYRVLIACGLLLAVAFLILLSQVITSWWLLVALFFIIGLLCCYQVIVFATGSALVASEFLGITVAFLNCINMLGGSFFHTLIGIFIDYFWTGSIDSNGMKIYSLQNYQYALMIIPFCAGIGAVSVYWLGRTTRRMHITTSLNLSEC